jgi:hypothetical protein
MRLGRRCCFTVANQDSDRRWCSMDPDLFARRSAYEWEIRMHDAMRVPAVIANAMKWARARSMNPQRYGQLRTDLAVKVNNGVASLTGFVPSGCGRYRERCPSSTSVWAG